MSKRRKTQKRVQVSIGSEKSKIILNPLTLSFPKELEGKFLRDYFKSSLITLRYSFILGILYYASFALLDNYALPEIKSQLYIIRFLIVCPVILGVFLLSYSKFFYKWWQSAAFITVLFSGLGIVAMLVISPDIGRATYYTGIILVLIYSYLLIKLRFTWSSVAGIIIMGGYVISSLLCPNCDQKVFTINTFFLFSANLLGMFGGYTLEYYSRRDFYFRYLLNKERKKVKMDNRELEVIVHEKTIELRNDIRKRKEIEKALRENERKFRFMAENSVDVLWQMDLRLRFTYVSPSIKALFQYLPEELIGNKLSQHTPIREFYKIARKTRHALKTYKIFDHITFEAELFKKDGTYLPVEISLKLILNEVGMPVGFQGVTRDILKRKIAEEEIKRSLVEKSLLLKELYHRTKNNMMVIAAMIKMQSIQTKSEELKKITAGIVSKINSMSLVHQKLYEAKDLSNINLKEYIEDLTINMIKSRKENSCQITTNFNLQDTIVTIDSAVPLGLVITELILNIFKHAFPKKKTGIIAIELAKDDSGQIVLQISDNGAGVGEDVNLRNTGSMGLQNVYSIIEYQLCGKVEYKVQNGLHWKIIIRDKQYKKRLCI